MQHKRADALHMHPYLHIPYRGISAPQGATPHLDGHPSAQLLQISNQGVLRLASMRERTGVMMHCEYTASIHTSGISAPVSEGGYWITGARGC